VFVYHVMCIFSLVVNLLKLFLGILNTAVESRANVRSRSVVGHFCCTVPSLYCLSGFPSLIFHNIRCFVSGRLFWIFVVVVDFAVTQLLQTAL
jgi:hypothetical protein